MSTILFVLLGLGAAAMPQRGAVTAVEVSLSRVETGQEVTITASGRNPCGAVHLITGDGNAVTHPITSLPSSHTYVYRKPGKYTIVAQGMGNCDGEAGATIEVTGKPLDPDPPPAPEAQITNVEIAPRPGRVREPVTITISGQGTCPVDVEFGDGNARRIDGELPHRTSYTYSVARRYTVIVRPVAPCQGRFTQELEVQEPAPAPELSRIMISPAPAVAGQPVSIRVDGTGRCSYVMQFGDGNNESLDTELPHTMTRYYQAPGRYTVTAAPKAPCRGGDRVTLEVSGGARATGITGIAMTPAVPRRGSQVTFTVSGSGECRLNISFGDGNARTYTGTLPMRIPHVYDTGGRFVVDASGEAPCGGTARMHADVRGP